MGAATVRAHIFVEGRVQGVFYRNWTFKQAKDFQLTGWVKNLADGRVEAVFEGSEKKVKKIVDKCGKGSLLSSVKHIDVSWEGATGEYKIFQIVA